MVTKNYCSYYKIYID